MTCHGSTLQEGGAPTDAPTARRRADAPSNTPVETAEAAAERDARAPGGGGRAALLLAPALAVSALAAYVPTLCPSVPGGDSGELLQIAIELGVAHPPGYPTWTMMAHAFSYLPWGGLAWRVNLSSAVCDAAAAGLLCAAVGAWCDSDWTGVAAGGAFAFAPLVWQYATQARRHRSPKGPTRPSPSSCCALICRKFLLCTLCAHHRRRSSH